SPRSHAASSAQTLPWPWLRSLLVVGVRLTVNSAITLAARAAACCASVVKLAIGIEPMTSPFPSVSSTHCATRAVLRPRLDPADGAPSFVLVATHTKRDT